MTTNWTDLGSATPPNGATEARTGPRPRPLLRRRGLPGGRAVVGGFFVAVSAVGVFAAYTMATAGPETMYVVARGDVPVGTELTAADLGVVAVDLPEGLAGRAFRDPDEVVGTVTVAPLTRYDLVQASQVVDAGGGETLEEMSFSIDASRALGGGLRPGERIDVLATYGSGTNAYTIPVVRDVLILSSGGDTGGLAGGSRVVLTVGLADPADALAVAHAVNIGDLILVRTTAVDGGERGDEAYRPEPPAADPPAVDDPPMIDEAPGDPTAAEGEG